MSQFQAFFPLLTHTDADPLSLKTEMIQLFLAGNNSEHLLIHPDSLDQRIKESLPPVHLCENGCHSDDTHC